MHKENAAPIVAALRKVKEQALGDSSELVFGICTEVNVGLELLVVPWSRSDVRRDWEDTRLEAFMSWPEYSGDGRYPVVDKSDHKEHDWYVEKGYYGRLAYFQYNHRALWQGEQLRLRLSLIDHCIAVYTAIAEGESYHG